MLTALRRLPPNVWLIGVISLLNDTASDLLYPLIPLYLSSVLMSGPKALGLIEGAAEATSSILKLVSGVLVDRTHRIKPWIVWGYGLAGFSRPLIAIATSWVGVLRIRILDRVGKGLRSSPRDALLAASVPPERRGLAFGLHRINGQCWCGVRADFSRYTAGLRIQSSGVICHFDRPSYPLSGDVTPN